MVEGSPVQQVLCPCRAKTLSHLEGAEKGPTAESAKARVVENGKAVPLLGGEEDNRPDPAPPGFIRGAIGEGDPVLEGKGEAKVAV